MSQKKVITPSMRAAHSQDRNLEEHQAGRRTVRHTWEINGVDCFATPRHFGDLSEALGILEEHGGKLDLEKLAQYALR